MSAKWRVVVQVKTKDARGTIRRVTVELPRGDWSMAELQDIGREAAEAGNVLTEESTTVDTRIRFPHSKRPRRCRRGRGEASS